MKTDEILTKAETKIASGYVCGFIGKEIADKCDISYHTVVRHTQNIYEKTGIPHSTNALVSWFLAKNFDLDLSDIKKKVIAFILFLLACFQIATTDFDSPFLRRIKIGRSMACRVWGRPRARRRGDTYYLSDK